MNADRAAAVGVLFVVLAFVLTGLYVGRSLVDGLELIRLP